jgi:hypothetical protein
VVGGKICLALAEEKDDPVAYVPGKYTVVLTTRENMPKVVSAGKPKGPLVDQMKKADADNDLIIALAAEGVPGFDRILAEAKIGAPPLAVTYLDAAGGVRGGTLTINLTAPSLVRLALDAKDAEAADKVEELLQQARRMASGGLVLSKQSMPRELKTTLGPLVTLAEELVDGAKAAKSGSQVTAEVKRPQVLDTANGAVVAAVLKSVMEARSAARQAQQMNNLKQIGLAMLNYVSAQNAFPPAAIEKNGKPLLSWRVAILPYVEEAALYERFHLDEPWDSPHNLELAKTMPAVFQSVGSPKDGKTRVMVFTGKGAAFDGGKKIGITDIRDGMSNTILCVEAGAEKAVPWTKPEDLPFIPEKPRKVLGKVSPNGFLAAFFDGSVRRLKVDNKTLKALITPDGSEVIDQSKLSGGEGK